MKIPNGPATVRGSKLSRVIYHCASGKGKVRDEPKSGYFLYGTPLGRKFCLKKPSRQMFDGFLCVKDGTVLRRLNLFLTICLLLLVCNCGVLAASSQSQLAAGKSLLPVNDLSTDYENAILNTLKYTKNQEQGFSLNSEYLKYAGSTYCDWLAFGCARYGYPDNTAAYLDSLESYVTASYESRNTLHNTKVTEYHRVILAMSALGADPAAFGQKKDGTAVNLLADGIYNYNALKEKGVNSLIWALIALDANNSPVPSGSKYDRAAIISNLIECELDKGGFALSGPIPDPDITAMAITALEPYYTTDPAVAQVVERALVVLSEMQDGDGNFSSWDSANAEATVQVIVALCSLGIDPLTDSRFIKNNNTVLDGLMVYYNPQDGGFFHTDPRKKSSSSDAMATDQGRYALTAYYRFVNNYNALYDLTPEGDRSSAEIEALIATIDGLPANPGLSDADGYLKAGQLYNLLNKTDKAKIKNSNKLTSGLARINSLQAAIDVAPPDNPDNDDNNNGNDNNNGGADSSGNSNNNGGTSDNSGGNNSNNKNNGGGSGASAKKSSGKGSTVSRGSNSGPAGGSLAKSNGAANSGATITTSNTEKLDISQLTNGLVPKEKFAAIKGQAKNLVLSGVTENNYPYTITFHGADIVNAIDFNMNITNASDYRNEIEALAEEPFIISFKHDGAFPGPALIEFASTPLTDGETLLFQYDPEAMSAVYNDKLTVSDSGVKFILDEAGDYFLSTRAKAGSLLAAAAMGADSGAAAVSEGFNIPIYAWYGLGGLLFLALIAFIIMWWQFPWFRTRVKYSGKLILHKLRIIGLTLKNSLKVWGRLIKYYGKLAGRQISSVCKIIKRAVAPVIITSGRGLVRGLKNLCRAVASGLSVCADFATKFSYWVKRRKYGHIGS